MRLLKEGHQLSLTEASGIINTLEAGSYNLGFNGRADRFELRIRPQFALPPKVYGDHHLFVARVLKTHQALGAGIGVLLSGPKGCGKTVTAKMMAIQSNLPVICVTDPFIGETLTRFLDELPNPCVVFIDEFEKVYPLKEQRDYFLTLLDGVAFSRHLFLLTSNEEDIGQYFHNRPGRIRYHRQYNTISPSMISEMIDGMMPRGKLREAVRATLLDLSQISPDAVAAVVSEAMIHKQVPLEFMKDLNVCDDLTGYFDISLRGTRWKTKPNLTPEQQEWATDFCYHANNCSLNDARLVEPQGQQFSKEIPTLHTKEFTCIFTGTIGGPPDDTLLHAVGLRCDDPLVGSRSLQWRNCDVTVTKNKGVYTLTHKTEGVLTAAPSQPLGSGISARAL